MKRTVCCSVGQRADSDAIATALRAVGSPGAESLSAIAARLGMNKGTLHRHREHLATPVAQAEQRVAFGSDGQQRHASAQETTGHGKGKRKPGRPTDLTHTLCEAIAKCVRAGCTMSDAAALNGVDDSTLYRWKQRGEAGEPLFSEFSESIARAEAEAKREAIEAVKAGRMMNGDSDWKASAWYLERKWPNEYGAQAQVHVKVERELAAALDRLKERLDPGIYVMVLSALAEETGIGATGAGEKGSRAEQPN